MFVSPPCSRSKHHHDARQRRQRDRDGVCGRPIQQGHRNGVGPARSDAAAVADVAAAVELGVGVDGLAIEAGLGHADAIVLPRHRREVEGAGDDLLAVGLDLRR
jgi:hypothetical protein